jgi:hypothetical protein
MAQSDLFSDFIKNVGGMSDKADQFDMAIKKLSESYSNINRVKESMKKSDLESLNVLKRTADVGNKILQQMKDNKKLNDDIKKSRKEINELETKIKSTKDKELRDVLIKLREQKRLEYEIVKVQQENMQKSIPLLGKMGKAGAVVSNSIAGFANLFSGGSMIFNVISTIVGGLFKIGKTMIGMLINPLKNAFNIFLEMQNTVGDLAADIGLTANESRNLLNNFASLSLSAMKFGGSMKDVATIFQEFSNTTNKNRFFSEREIGQLTELGLGTGLGVQGASELAASFDNIGVSLEKTINLTDRARNLAAKYNVNTTKVLKTYQGLVQSLTGIGFGKGLDNLTKLAAKATAIRFDIAESTKAFADAFFDPEKAVEASARMQTLGGKFAASFGDPMQLAFESMTDPTALAEKFASTVSEIVQKDGQGNYFISPADRKTLKIAAENLGQNYEDAVATAIEQKKIADKMTYLSKSNFNLMGMDEGDKLSLAGLMQLNEKGKYEIKMSDGTMQLLENMTDKSQLKTIVDARAKNEQAAIQRLNMMQRLENVVNRFMMGFSKVFDQLFGGTNFESFLQMVENAGEKISQFIVKDLLGNDGLANGFNTLIDKAKIIFSEIEKIFAGNGSFMSKVGETLKLLFKDVAVPIISEVISFAAPILRAGIAELLNIIGGALPDIFGGSSLKEYAAKLRGEAIGSDKSGILSGIYANSGAEIAASGDKSANQGMSAIAKMKGSAMGLNVAAYYGKKGVGKGLATVGGNMISKFGSGKLAEAGLKIGMFGEKMAAKTIAKRIPVIGSLVSFGLAIKDAYEGDFAGAGMQALSGTAGLLDLVAPGVGTAASLAIDTADAAREMGAFDDGVIYKDGSYAKFAKGDMVQFIDQAAYEKAFSGGGMNAGGSASIQHTGVITIKSDDGKVVTWDQMYNARDLIASRMASINKSYENGFGNYQNPNISPIKPLI